jgi:transcriptional regulator with XRE-family HTH domain
MLMDLEFVSRRIGQLRTQMGVSARDMSMSIGQAHNYISNIENGKSAPSIQGFFYICEYLKITPMEFFDEGNKNPVLIEKLIKELRTMNDDSLEHLLGLIREMKNNV